VTDLISPRDLSFDGQGSMWVAGRNATGSHVVLARLTAQGALSTVRSQLSGLISAARVIEGGNLALGGSFEQGGTAIPGVTVITPSGALVSQTVFMPGFPYALIATPMGRFVALDSIAGRLVQFGGTTQLDVDTSAAQGTAPLGMRGGAMSADGRHLFVAGQDSHEIVEFEVNEAGLIQGDTRRQYTTLPSSSPRSLAFDECGNLYVTTFVTISGSSRGAVLRVPPGGGAPGTVALFDPGSGQAVIAFGRGPGFPSTFLYAAVEGGGQPIQRINIGIPGARVWP
jgi:hypothetical protein